MAGEMVSESSISQSVRPIRVLYSFPHALGGSGIGIAALHQVRAAVAAGFEVTVYATSLAAPVDGAERVVETLVVRGRRVPHRAFGSVRKAYEFHDAVVARAITTRPYAFDLVHAWPRGCIRTLTAARRVGLPALRELCSPHSTTACELAEREAARLGMRLPRRHAHRGTAGHLRREEAEYQAAGLLLAPSDHVVRTFTDRGYDPDRLVRHAYGFDPSRFFPATGERPGRRPFTAVFAGRGEPNKGLHHALRAWCAAGSPGRFYVCGTIMPAYRARIASLLASPGVRETGFVEDLGALLREADVLVLPSVTEGSALVTMEAAACGCVPLISDACGSPVSHMVDGMVHPVGDVEELSSHLRLLAEDRSLLAKLRDGAVTASAGWTWEQAGVRLANIYRAARRVPDPLPGDRHGFAEPATSRC